MGRMRLGAGVLGRWGEDGEGRGRREREGGKGRRRRERDDGGWRGDMGGGNGERGCGLRLIAGFWEGLVVCLAAIG